VTELKKIWYTLTEASQQLNLDIDSILYLGTIGELELSFNWVDFHQEDIDVGSHLSFTCSKYIRMEEDALSYTEHLPLPNYCKNPLNRLATLSIEEIGLLNKKRKIRLKQGKIGDIELDISPTVFRNNDAYLMLTISDVVITAEALYQYIEKHPQCLNTLMANDTTQEQVVKHQHQKEIDNLQKILALAAISLTKLQPSLIYGKQPNCEAIAKRLVKSQSNTMNLTGLSQRAIREKISKGLKLLKEPLV
jgi:hypothetical protein